MIKIRLEKWENSLVMQVLDQSGSASASLPFANDDGWCLSDESVPELDISHKYVNIRRGGTASHEEDYDVRSYTFDNNQERDKTHASIVKLFTDYNRYVLSRSEGVTVKTIFTLG